MRVLTREAEAAGVDIIRHPSEDVPLVLMDTDQMTQVFLNILLNAIQATPRGGKVFVHRTKRDDGRLVVVVEDTGEGIPRDNLDKLFDPFFSTKKKGTGLGLPIVKSIVEGHDGEIEVESESGKGTKIIVTLRMYRVPDESLEPTRARLDGSVALPPA
jgi:signal transduction histidine kinase